MSLPDFSLLAAQKAAASDQLDAVDLWLSAGWRVGQSRPAGGLQKQRRWWLGPLEVELDRLSRCCGPEPDMEYCVPAEAWDKHVSRLAAGLMEPTALPPLIVVNDNGALNIRDGNHRYEAQPTGFWDRAPRPTARRLRRVLAQLDISKTAPLHWPLRKKGSVTAHLHKEIQAHRRSARPIRARV